MASFAVLTGELCLKIQDFAKKLREASTLADEFATNMQGKINTSMVEPIKKAKFEFKDVARIVQGILISKAFYSGLNSIRRAKDAVWEFSQELEYAQMVYSNLFGSADLAAEFINVLKDFAAVTPFSFKQSEEAAKRLLAYGLEYKNVMYVMQGVLSAATVQGTDTVIEPISRAFGQIYTKGRLMNEEMRQLAEAGIPVYDILQEKLGLTSKQLRNLGKVAVPASTAINALVEGINERFGTTLQYASLTTQGIISNIKDNAVMLFAGIFKPFTEMTKNALGRFGEFISELRSLQELGGIGAVFERLVPEGLQQAIRTLIANVRVLWNILKTNLGSILNVIKSLLVSLMHAFNAIAPVLLTVAGIITGVGKAIAGNQKLMRALTIGIMAAAVAWAVYKVQAVAAAVTTALIKGMTAAVKALIGAFNFLVAHPIWSLLLVGVGLFIALSGASDKFRNSLNNLYKGFYSLGGMDTSKILLPEAKDRAADLDKFNNSLSGAGKSMSDLKDKAAKAVKGLLGFDEVFSLKTPEEENSDKYDGMFDGLTGMDFSDMSLEMPDVASITSDFVDNLVAGLGGQENLVAASIGSVLGAALGAVIGGPIGAKLGALIGGLAGWFWPQVSKALGLTDVGSVALPIATVMGAAIGFVVGGPMGAAIGVAIGGLVGWITDSITRGIQEGDWSKVGLPVGLGLGAAIGMLAGGPMGATIGAAVGGLVGWIVDLFTKGFTTGDWNVSGISLGLGTGIGAAIGMIVGGPAGAAIGAAVGALVGWITSLIINNWKTISDWFGGVGQWFAQTGQSIGQFFVDIGSGIGQFFENLGTWLSVAWTDITTWFSDMLTAIGKFFSDIWTAASTWFINTVSAVGKFFADMWVSISKWFSDTLTAFGKFFSDLWTAISKAADTLFQPLADAAVAIWGVISTVLYDIWTGITTVMSDIFLAIETVAQDIWTAITVVSSRVWETLTNIWELIRDLFIMYGTMLWETVTEWFGAIWDTISTTMQNIWNTIVETLTNIWTEFSTWFQKIFDEVSTILTNIWTDISDTFKDILQTFTDNLAAIWKTVSDNFQLILKTITEILDAIWKDITDTFKDIVKTFKDNLVAIWKTVSDKFSEMLKTISENLSAIWKAISDTFKDICKVMSDNLKLAWDAVTKYFSNMYTSIKTSISDMYTSVKTGISNIYGAFKGWISDMWSNVFNKFFGWIDSAIGKLRDFFGLDSKAKSTDTSYANSPAEKTSSTAPQVSTGHALGGVFNREHIARFAEGNKAEAIIPLENESAMQPFVDAVSNGITSALLPIMVNMSGNNQNHLQPLYVGTLIADDRSLKELERKMEVIRISESQRRSG